MTAAPQEHVKQKGMRFEVATIGTEMSLGYMSRPTRSSFNSLAPSTIPTVSRATFVPARTVGADSHGEIVATGGLCP